MGDWARRFRQSTHKFIHGRIVADRNQIFICDRKKEVKSDFLDQTSILGADRFSSRPDSHIGEVSSPDQIYGGREVRQKTSNYNIWDETTEIFYKKRVSFFVSQTIHNSECGGGAEKSHSSAATTMIFYNICRGSDI